jgi:hypothetical protein
MGARIGSVHQRVAAIRVVDPALGAHTLGHDGHAPGGDLARTSLGIGAEGQEREVRAARRPVLVAIDQALRSPAYCACGESLEVTTHGASVWLECLAFGRPSRAPAMVALLLRELVHDRTRVIAIPSDLAPASAAVSRPATAGCNPA